MLDTIKRIVIAYKRSFTKKLKKRSAIDRYKARQYYRKHRTKIKVRRKQYLKKTTVAQKSRKLFKRTKPSWMAKRTKAKSFKPKLYKPKKIKAPKPGKIYAPKRRTAKR